jgi:hypothetical protein
MEIREYIEALAGPTKVILMLWAAVPLIVVAFVALVMTASYMDGDDDGF